MCRCYRVYFGVARALSDPSRVKSGGLRLLAACVNSHHSPRFVTCQDGYGTLFGSRRIKIPLLLSFPHIQHLSDSDLFIATTTGISFGLSLFQHSAQIFCVNDDICQPFSEPLGSVPEQKHIELIRTTNRNMTAEFCNNTIYGFIFTLEMDQRLRE